LLWLWQLKEGEEREEEEEGVVCLVCHSHWRVLLIAGAVSPGTAGGEEGSCGRAGHLLLLRCRGEWWSFEISPVCLRSKIHWAGGDSLSITSAKILFLKLLL